MKPKRRKSDREQDLTARYLSGEFDEDQVESQQRFSRRSTNRQQNKIEETALLRAAEEQVVANLESLPIGQVTQVYSLFSEVEHAGVMRLCVLRKTLARVSGAIVVGDFVRFRETGAVDEQNRPEAVIEQILPRRTVLTRAESFKGLAADPIVANADQMLIVASIHQPDVRWGLVDRMLIAAQAGRLRPIICLNKIDLADADASPAPPGRSALEAAREALAHYRSLGIRTLETSVARHIGLDELRQILQGQTTVLAGHSGVGKSSLIRQIQPTLDIRIGAISGYTGKGRHTTTSARRYSLEIGGHVIDTPGVKMFGLWGVTPDNLDEFFPDVAAGTAPDWRQDSYQRIRASLAPA